MQFGFKISSAALCDLMENETEQIDVKNNIVTLDVGNFEIVTIKVLTE